MDPEPQTIRFTVDFWNAIKFGAGFTIGAFIAGFVAIILLVQLVVRGIRRLFHKRSPAGT
jgi:tetrahydromethanopterin S-methyltransferase subunit B